MSRFEVPFNQAKDIVCAAFPGATSRRTVKIWVTESYQIADYWSEGSRNSAAFVKLDTMASVPATALPSHARQTQNNPFNLAIAEVEISPGYVVVEHCIFQGKDLGYRIYIHASNVTPQLCAPAPTDIDERDKRILACFRGLKSGAYRNQSLSNLKFSDADKERLASKGYLKVTKVGTSITVEGRSVCSDTTVY